MLLSLLCVAGCKGCGKSERIAELVAIHHAVFRDFASTTEQWQQATKGEDFSIGDGLKTGPNATARLRLLPNGELVVKSDTVVRFQANAPGDQGRRLSVETGAVEIESANVDLGVKTAVGLSRIEKGSRVRIRSTDKSSNFDVLVGAIKVDNQGKTVFIASGKSLELDVGQVSVEEKEKTNQVQETKPEEKPAEEVRENTEEDIEPFLSQAPTVADITISAGESATIHDPAPPTNVRIPITNCENGGVIDVALVNREDKRTSVRGDLSGIVGLKKGFYRYRVRCLKDGKPEKRPVALGQLVVQQDPAVMRLSKTVPTLTVDADGRPYTVRYQNRLPQITFKWPDPAVSNSYTFHIKPEKGNEKTSKSPHPECVYNSGQIDEGVHRFFFSTADGRKSAVGMLRIAFDNTARTAYLSEPVEGKATPGQPVRVSGAVLTDSKVSLDGISIPVDAQGLFRTEIAATGGNRAIAIRVQHKASQVQYFLRHLATKR
jgi:hypothetical protein